VALGSSADLELTRSGPHAYRELRSKGERAAWVCHLGRQATHGSFAEFQERVLGLGTRLGDAGAFCETLEGDAVALDWTTPFLVYGKPQTLDAARHLDSPYCRYDLGSDTMDIRFGEWAMQLDMSTEGSAEIE